MATFASSGDDPSNDVSAAPPSAWGALALLSTVYSLNYLDRTLIYILFKPIKAEMAFSDLQLALLGSTSFVLFYTILGVPFGRVADRVSRPVMIAVGLSIWSLFSGLSGYMDSFLGIFLCRVMVGVGEATLGPAALSLLAEIFPARQRATAGALYSAGIPIGAGLALAMGGKIAAAYGWRYAFYFLGFPGLLLALAVLMLPEPRRGRVSAAKTAAPLDVGPALRAFAEIPALRWLVVGYAFFALSSNSLSMWIPTWLSGRFAAPLADVGLYVGMAAVVGGLVGTTLGGVAADAVHRARKGGRLLFTAACAGSSVALWLALLYAPSLTFALGPVTLLMATGLVWLGPAAADVQDLVPAQTRGLAIGVYFFVVNAIGYGLGPPLIGKLSDAMGGATDPMMMAKVLLVCPASVALAAALLWWASRQMPERAA